MSSPVRPGSGLTPRIDGARVAEAWRALVPGMAQMPVRGIGFRLFWTRGDAAGYRDFHVGLGAHFILGAHSLADIVLGGDPDISQRHLLLLGARTPSGAPALRILDLRARHPMVLADERPHRSLKVHGPFALRLGSHVVAGFPLGEAPPPEVPETLIEDRVQGPAGAEPPKSPAPRSVEVPKGTYLAPEPVGPYRRITRIEALKRPSTLVEVASSRPLAAGATLVARRQGTVAEVPIAEDDLEGGVLVGRAERCIEAGLRTVMTPSISRIHAILIADESRSVHLLDAASTNGTFVDGTRVRSALLGPGAKVHLGTEIQLELKRSPPPQ